MSSPKSVESVIKRSTPPNKGKYINYRQELRLDFWYSCAYCSITEIEAQGIAFEIDHYFPQKHFAKLINDYTNLMWSCATCNGLKEDYFADDYARQKGYFIIRPDEDDPRNHFDSRKHQLSPKTATGEFNLEKLRLNRLQLQKIREIRERLYEAQGYISFGITELLSIPLDTIKKEDRPIVEKLRSNLGENYERLITSLEDFIKALAKSELLDEEPNKNTKMKQRRQYLNKIKAITPDYDSQKPCKNQSRKSKSRRKS